MKRLRTLKSFQIFKSEIKKSKTYSGWYPFLGLSNGTTLFLQIQSGRTFYLNSFFLSGDSERKGEDKTVAESAARMATAPGIASQSRDGYYDRGGYHSLHPLLFSQSGEERHYCQFVSRSINWAGYHDRGGYHFMYRRPILCTLHGAVDFFNSWRLLLLGGGGGGATGT